MHAYWTPMPYEFAHDMRMGSRWESFLLISPVPLIRLSSLLYLCPIADDNQFDESMVDVKAPALKNRNARMVSVWPKKAPELKI